MTSAKTITAHSGVEMPAIVYGTAWKKAKTAALVIKAIRAGFRGIDTACQPKHYSEPGVGKGLKAIFDTGLKRDSLYIQTKFTPLSGQDPKRIPYDPEAPLDQQVRQSFEASLKNLGIDTLDSLVLHTPLASPSDMKTVWQALEDLVTAGGTKQIGISNCYDPQMLQSLVREAKVKPAVVQNRFYKDTGFDRDIRQFCAKNQIVYQSFWTLTANPHILKDAVVQAIASRDELTPAQTLFRYLHSIGVQPLTGTNAGQHMREDLNAVAGTLSTPDQQAMDRLFR